MMWHGPTRCRQDGREKARIELSKEAVWLANVDGAAGLQVGGDAGGPERMAADPRREAGGDGPPLYHGQGIVPAERPVRELAGFPEHGAEQRPLPVGGDARGLDVGVEISLGVV